MILTLLSSTRRWGGGQGIGLSAFAVGHYQLEVTVVGSPLLVDVLDGACDDAFDRVAVAGGVAGQGVDGADAVGSFARKAGGQG